MVKMKGIFEGAITGALITGGLCFISGDIVLGGWLTDKSQKRQGSTLQNNKIWLFYETQTLL